MLKTKTCLKTMDHPKRFVPMPSRIAVCVALALSLAACGDSDLEQLHAESLEAALKEANESDPLVGAAAPAVEMPEAAMPEIAMPENGLPAPSAATLQVIDANEYSLVFHDEFTGTSLDSDKWNTAMAWGPELTINDEQQYYVDTQSNPNSEFNPFSFDGEALIISAASTPDSMVGSVNGQSYVSGALTTLNKFDMSYGYIEARVDVPEGRGLWPSLWMLGTDFVDLKPQLYLMEFNGGNPNSFYHNYNYTDAEGNLRSPKQHEVVVNGASAGWHTMGVRWSVGELTYYVNGYPTFKITGENVPSQAMYFIMNLAVGGLWVDEPDDSTPQPSEFKVDYVRVYQRN